MVAMRLVNSAFIASASNHRLDPRLLRARKSQRTERVRPLIVDLVLFPQRLVVLDLGVLDIGFHLLVLLRGGKLARVTCIESPTNLVLFDKALDDVVHLDLVPPIKVGVHTLAVEQDLRHDLLNKTPILHPGSCVSKMNGTEIKIVLNLRGLADDQKVLHDGQEGRLGRCIDDRLLEGLPYLVRIAIGAR